MKCTITVAFPGTSPLNPAKARVMEKRRRPLRYLPPRPPRRLEHLPLPKERKSPHPRGRKSPLPKIANPVQPDVHLQPVPRPSRPAPRRGSRVVPPIAVLYSLTWDPGSVVPPTISVVSLDNSPLPRLLPNPLRQALPPHHVWKHPVTCKRGSIRAVKLRLPGRIKAIMKTASKSSGRCSAAIPRMD